LYSYRLKGISDTSWSTPANIHEASYESLSPGNYTFEVKTLGWNGEYSAPATFSFFISTPFWKQGWFIGLCALLVAAMVYGLYRYRIKQIMRLQQVRNTIATDLHDDIGSALTNISILAELSRNKNQQNVFAENLPGRISEESTLAQQALDDIIWSVNSNNDNLNQTMARMRRYAAEVFEPIGINCKIDFENIPNDHKLNMEQRKDIYLVFKECLNNIIKHASAKNVFIKIDLERNLFNLKIQDDGKGFDTLKQTDRNGVKNIRERVQRWNGKLAIHSSTGEGTTVDCSLPLASPK
jgi:signal transduction histidine kinase